MILPFVKKVVMFIPKKLLAINHNIDKIINRPENTDKTFTFITKVTRATTGAAGAAKGIVDFAEAVPCQAGVFATVSAIGVAADALQICTSFIPGPNLTAVVTMPISYGYKVFVWCCKRSKLPFL